MESEDQQPREWSALSAPADAGDWVRRGAWLTLGAAVVVGTLVLIGAALPILALVFVAVLLGAALDPVVDRLRARFRIGRVPAVLVVFGLFFAVALLLLLLVVPAAVTQADRISGDVPYFLAQLHAWADQVRPEALATSLTALVEAAQRAAQPAPPDPDEVIETGLTIAEVVVSAASLLALVFFWLLEHPRLRRYALAFVPRRRRAGTRASWLRVERRLGSWVRGQLILMGTMAAATTIAYVVLGLPAAILLGLIAGLFEAIPIVGPLLGAIPAIAVAATISPELAIAVGIVYLALQILEGYVLVPIVMRNTIGLSPFTVLVSLLAGAAVGGLTGAFLAVPLVATLETVVENLQVRAVPVRPERAARPAPPATLDAPLPTGQSPG